MTPDLKDTEREEGEGTESISWQSIGNLHLELEQNCHHAAL